jgi:uncharacterized protein (DUF58 family)
VARPIVTALLGAALCLVGGAFDTASLYLPGVAIALIALASVVWVALAATGAHVKRLPVPATAVEDEPFRLQVEARLGWLPAPGGVLHDPLLTRGEPIAGRHRVRLDSSAALPRRGEVELAPSVLAIQDPLHLCTLRKSGPAGPTVLVLPRIDPVTATGEGGEGGSGRHAGFGSGSGHVRSWNEDAADGLDFDGLRPYREGAPASRIHWATLARRGEMMERRFVAERASAPLVVLDVADAADEAALDAAVRATASLCVALARAGGVALLLPGDRRPVDIGHELGAWGGVHKRLALVEQGPSPILGGLGPRSGAVFWVTAAALAGPPRALERLPARAHYVVAPTLPPRTSPAFDVGGCRGALIDRRRRSAAA